MISVEKARALIEKKTPVLPGYKKPVNECLFHVLAQSIDSPISLPPFRQSAMDGYAIIHADATENPFVLKKTGESAAGSTNDLKIKSGETIRIFTGAPVPSAASAVVMQEKVELKENEVIIHQDNIKEGQNIRPVGEIIKAGENVMKKGQLLTPAATGFLHSLGITEVEVYQKPVITVAITGNELIDPGQKELEYGQIFESNSITLEMGLKSFHFDKVNVIRVKDDFKATKAALGEVLENSDALIVSGGISVGDYDYVHRALDELGTKEVFYKVRQKPGKPMYFGINKEKPVFGLPGNPASALICLYEYVIPSLKQYCGSDDIHHSRTTATALKEFEWKGGKAIFLRAKLTDQGVIPLKDQNSASLRSFARANALIFLPESKKGFRIGDTLEVHRLY